MTTLRASRLLVEAYALRIRLLEGRLDFLKQQFLPRILKALPELAPQFGRAPPTEHIGRLFPEEAARAVFDHVISFDPSPTKKFSQWLLTLVVKGRLLLEDLPKAPDDLTTFARVQRMLPPAQRDIMRIGSLADLGALVQPYGEKKSQREITRDEEAEMRRQTKIIYNGPDYLVLIPHTQAASCYFGQNTRWCTAATKMHNYFDSYNNRGPLYIILDKRNNQRWQFHFEDHMFMNELDQPIDIDAFLAEHPKIAQIFQQLEGENEEVGKVTLGGHPLIVTLMHREHSPVVGASLLFRSQRTAFERPVLDITLTHELEINDVHARVPRHLSAFDFLFSGDPKQLIQLLNRVGCTPGRHVIDFADHGIFFNNNKWGTFDEFGEIVLHSGDCSWAHVAAGQNAYFGLLPHELFAHVILEANVYVEDDGTTLVLGDPTSNNAAEIGERVIDLIQFLEASERFPSPQRFDKERSGFKLDEMPNEQILRMIKVKPELLGVSPLYRVMGDTPLVRQKIVASFDELDVPHEEWVEGGLIIEKWKTIDKLVAQRGSDFARRVHDNVYGDHDFNIDYEAGVDESDARELYDELKPPYKQWVINYAKATYGEGQDQQSDQQSDQDDQYDDGGTDWNDPREVWDVLVDNGDDVVSQLEWAYADGLRVGAENDMYDDYIKSIKGYDDDKPWTLVFTINRNERGVESMQFDGPCYAVVSTKDAAALCDDRAMLEDIASQGWFDKELDVEEPYNGWTGYDHSAAMERAEENLHEVLPEELKPQEPKPIGQAADLAYPRLPSRPVLW